MKDAGLFFCFIIISDSICQRAVLFFRNRMDEHVSGFVDDE